MSRKDTISDLDFMAGSIHEILQFNTKEGPIDVKFNCIDDKNGIYAQVWNKDAKKTINFIKAQIKDNPVLKDVDKIMIF